MSRLRTFLAIDLEDHVRDEVISLQENLARSMTDVKWVEPDNIHLTLLFLGEVNERELPALCRASQQAVAKIPEFSISLEAVGAFPNDRRPRILWVGLGAGAEEVVEVHDALETALLKLGCYRREERQYTPHVTLGRIKNEDASVSLSPLQSKQQIWHANESQVSEVHIMSSEMTRQGPTYALLGRAKLAQKDDA